MILLHVPGQMIKMNPWAQFTKAKRQFILCIYCNFCSIIRHDSVQKSCKQLLQDHNKGLQLQNEPKAGVYTEKNNQERLCSKLSAFTIPTAVLVLVIPKHEFQEMRFTFKNYVDSIAWL